MKNWKYTFGEKCPFATLSLSCPLLSAQRKTLFYFFVKKRQCIRLFWSLYLFEPEILWNVIHKCLGAHHFLWIVCLLWLWLWGETVRMGSLLWPCQGRTRPLRKEPQAELVCLFYFAKKFFPPTSFLALYLQGCRCAGEVYFSSPHMYKHTHLHAVFYFHSLVTQGFKISCICELI